MNIPPVDRALSIYGALADRSEAKGARERLSRHLMKLYIAGEKDEHRLTVEGLSYLRKLDREIDSQTAKNAGVSFAWASYGYQSTEPGYVTVRLKSPYDLADL